MHKILLNSVLLSPSVSGGVRQNATPGQTPLGHPLFASWVSWGQDSASWVGQGQEYGLVSVFYKNTRRVLSYDVLRQQKTGVMTKGVVSGGSLTSSQAYNVEPVTNISSSSCANNGRRGESSTLAAVRRGFVFHSSRLDNTVDLYVAKPKPDIRPKSRFLPTPPAFDAPVRGVPVGILTPRLVSKN